jgi:hypothetical protein
LTPNDAEDLYPQDFLVALERPPGYMGASDFHDLGDVEPEGYESNRRAFVRSVKGGDDDECNLPRALDSFVLSGAIKLFRCLLAGAHHSLRHRDVIGMAGDTLHIFGHDHLGPDLTQRLANGHHKVRAAL